MVDAKPKAPSRAVSRDPQRDSAYKPMRGPGAGIARLRRGAVSKAATQGSATSQPKGAVSANPGDKARPAPAAAPAMETRAPARSPSKDARRTRTRMVEPSKRGGSLELLCGAVIAFATVVLSDLLGNKATGLSLVWPVEALALAWTLQRGYFGLIGVSIGVFAAFGVFGLIETGWPIGVASIVAPTIAAATIRAFVRRFSTRAAAHWVFVLSATVLLVMAPVSTVIGLAGFTNNSVAQADPAVFALGLWLAQAVNAIAFTPLFGYWIRPTQENPPFRKERHRYTLRHAWPALLLAAVAGTIASLVVTLLPQLTTMLLWLGLPALAIVAATVSPRTAGVAMAGAVSMLLWKEGALIPTLSDPNAQFALLQTLAAATSGAIVFQILLSLSVDRRQNAEELARQASEDAATGLANERGLHQAIERWTRARERRDLLIAEVTVSDFHSFVDLIGPQASRLLLRTVGERVRRCAGAGLTCLARPTTRRFVVISQADTTHEDLALRLSTGVDRMSISIGERRITLRVTVGVVRVPADAKVNRERMLAALSVVSQKAAASTTRRASLSYADASVSNHRDQLMRIEEVKRAIEERRFKLMAQPIVPATDPRMKETRRMHYEVLARMLDRDGQPLAPAKFLPAVAQGNLTREFDRMIIAMTLEKIASDPALRKMTETCSINVTGSSLCDPELAAFIEQELVRTGVAPRMIAIELTESELIVDFDVANDNIRRLSLLGVTIVIDDFGTGLATFDWVKRISAQCLKIDGSFVRNIATNPLDREIVLSIVRVAHVIGARTVAESVESMEIAAQLRELGVDYLQGFAISKPIAIDLFGRRLLDPSTAMPAAARSADQPRREREPTLAV